MDITASVYHNDLIMETILQFVPFEERLNIELSSWRLYNLSKETSSIQKIQLSLFVWENTSGKAETQKKFKISVRDFYGLKVPYNPKINERHLSRKDFEVIFKMCSQRFRYQIKKVFFGPIMDLNTLKLIQKYFKCITVLKCDSFDDDCIEYLKSERQTLSKKIKRLKLGVDDVQKSYEIITSFENLDSLECISVDKSGSGKVFQLVNLLKSNYDLESGRRNLCQSHLKFSLTVSFTPSLTTTLPQLAGMLTQLNITFNKFQDEPFLAEFFRAINIHNFKKVTLSNLMLNREIINLMAFNGKSKLRILRLINYYNLSETRSIGDILPNTLKHLYISGNVYSLDIEIISKRCSSLESLFLDGSFVSLMPYHEYIQEVQDMVFCLKKLKECMILHNVKPQFLIDLWNTNYNLERLFCSVLDVNKSALDEICFKVNGKSRREYPINERFYTGYLVDLVLPKRK